MEQNNTTYKFNKRLVYDQQHKALKKWAKVNFKGTEMLGHGFAIDLITVSFKNDEMHIYDFELSGKSFDTVDKLPMNGLEMLSIMKSRCGTLKMNKQLRPTNNFNHE
jgi:hypothetical protein